MRKRESCINCPNGDTTCGNVVRCKYLGRMTVHGGRISRTPPVDCPINKGGFDMSECSMTKEDYEEFVRHNTKWLYDNTNDYMVSFEIVKIMEDSINRLYPKLPAYLNNDGRFSVGDTAVLLADDGSGITAIISNIRTLAGKTEYEINLIGHYFYVDSSFFRPVEPGDSFAIDRLDHALTDDTPAAVAEEPVADRFNLGDPAVLTTEDGTETMITISGMREKNGKVQYFVAFSWGSFWIGSQNFRMVKEVDRFNIAPPSESLIDPGLRGLSEKPGDSQGIGLPFDLTLGPITKRAMIDAVSKMPDADFKKLMDAWEA